MGVLTEAIDAYDAQKREKLPGEILETMAGATLELKALGIEDRSLRAGDPMRTATNQQSLAIRETMMPTMLGLEHTDPIWFIMGLSFGTWHQPAPECRFPTCSRGTNRRISHLVSSSTGTTVRASPTTSNQSPGGRS